jgi:arylsulfatase I/J
MLLQIPAKYISRFANISNTYRRLYSSMVGFLDDAVGEVVDALRSHELWDNTLLVFVSDNGGPVYLNGTSGANNHPLRGGKMANWEGGIRTAAFVSGGVLPSKMRGTKLSGLIAIFDWHVKIGH